MRMFIGVVTLVVLERCRETLGRRTHALRTRPHGVLHATHAGPPTLGRRFLVRTVMPPLEHAGPEFFLGNTLLTQRRLRAYRFALAAAGEGRVADDACPTIGQLPVDFGLAGRFFRIFLLGVPALGTLTVRRLVEARNAALALETTDTVDHDGRHQHQPQDDQPLS